MTSETATTFLVVVASTAIFATALSALRMYSRDAFRQRAFALRDELFLYAADGNVPFDHPAYWRLRLMMNATIRFTHRMTFGELILPMCVLGVTKYESIEDSPYQRWQEALSECHPDVRKALVDYQRRFSELIAVYVLAANPFAAVPVIFIAVIAYGLTHPHELIRRDAARVENAAVRHADTEWLAQQGAAAA